MSQEWSEFIDVAYAMQIQEQDQKTASEIYATKKAYKILDIAGRMTKVNALEIVVYRDVKTVYCKVQEILE